MKKLIWIGVIGVFAGAAAGWTLHGAASSDPQAANPGQTQAADPAPAISVTRTVALDPDDVKNMGLAVTVLRPMRRAPEVRATAVVLSPQSLAPLSGAYVTDTKDLAMARANLAVAQNESRRQNVLYRENQNTSLKALQAARGALASSRAQANAAALQLPLDAIAAEQQWGPVVGKWLVARSPEFEKILDQQEWLVEVTFGATDPHSAPPDVRLVAPSGAFALGRFISSFPRINPVIQGLNYLYAIPALPGFAPGLNLVAEVPAGAARRGVVIPAAAVIWSQGQAWAYKETATNRFERLPIATDDPVTNGWFVTAGFTAGDKVVTRAVEELFSAESQPGARKQGGGGDDDD